MSPWSTCWCSPNMTKYEWMRMYVQWLMQKMQPSWRKWSCSVNVKHMFLECTFGRRFELPFELHMSSWWKVNLTIDGNVAQRGTSQVPIPVFPAWMLVMLTEQDSLETKGIANIVGGWHRAASKYSKLLSWAACGWQGPTQHSKLFQADFSCYIWIDRTQKREHQTASGKNMQADNHHFCNRERPEYL